MWLGVPDQSEMEGESYGKTGISICRKQTR